MGTCPTDSSFLCPNSNWVLSPVQVIAPLTWPGGPPSPSGATSKVTPEEPPHSKWKEETPFHKALSRSHWEAFGWDSRLVQKAREDYYQENHLHFNSENSCNLMDVFQNMNESTGLPGSKIYKIQETWTGWCKLEYTNYTLKNLLKGLKFFHPVPPSESLKGHGLNQYPPSRCTLPFQWGNPLSIVQKGRVEWGGDHQSSADDTSQVRPGLWEVLLLSLGYIQGHPAPQLEELPAICRRRPWWVIFFSLTASMRLIGPTFQRWDLDQGSEGGSIIHWTTTSGMAPTLSMWKLKGGSGGGTASHQVDACILFQSSCIMPKFQ